MRRCQVSGLSMMAGALGFLESRTAIPSSRAATSTQLPPSCALWLLLRQRGVACESLMCFLRSS